MDPSLRVIMELPLTELWNDQGSVEATRVRNVGIEEVRLLLRGSAVQFIVANCGSPIDWVPLGDAYRFWKTEVKQHLVPTDAEYFRLKDFPDEWCYVGSEWKWASDTPIIVLEVQH